jgi:hypothetical protein
MQLIQTINVGSGGASSISITNIPQDGTDLMISLSLRSTSTGTGGIFAVFNNTYSGYTRQNIKGNGSGVTAARQTGASELFIPTSFPGTTGTANTFGTMTINVLNYAVNGAGKSISAHSTHTQSSLRDQSLTTGSWSGTAPITQIDLVYETFAQSSSISIYKITRV